MTFARIYNLTNKPVPVGTDEIELQETANGSSFKTTLTAVFAALETGQANQDAWSFIQTDDSQTTSADSSTDTLIIEGGAGIATSADTALNKIIIEQSGGITNAFGVVEVDGGVQVDADSPTDVLTLNGGTNISVTADTGTDTVTISQTGGGQPDQDLWDTIVTDFGSITPESTTETLTFEGGTNIITSVDVSTNTVTIDSVSGDWVNVTDHGVVNDAVDGSPDPTGTDNTTVLQSLVTSTLQDGDTLYFPPGGYIFDEIDFTGLSDITVIGEGAELFGQDSYGTGHTFTFTQCTNLKVRGFKFTRLRHDNDNGASPPESQNRSAIAIKGCNNVDISHCNFWDVQYGVSASEDDTTSPDTPSVDLFVHHCTMSSRVSPVVANKIYMADTMVIMSHQLNAIISENNLTDARLSLSNNNQSDSDTGPFPVNPSRNIQIINNNIRGNLPDTGIYFSGGTDGCVAQGNILDISGKDAIKAINWCRNVVFSGNILRGGGDFETNSPYSIQLTAVVQASITGNVIEMAVPTNTQNQQGIGIYGSENVTVSGNHISSLDTAAPNSAHAIVIDTSASTGDADCRNITITGNVLKNIYGGRGVVVINSVSPAKEVTDVVISSNTMINVDMGVSIAPNCNRWQICNNQIRDTVNHGIHLGTLEGCNHIWVHHNHASDLNDGSRALINTYTVVGTPTDIVCENNWLEGVGTIFKWQTASDSRYVTGRNNMINDDKNEDLATAFTTTPVTMVASDCEDKTFTNDGAAETIHFDLPSSSVGMHVKFYIPNGVTEKIEVDPGTTSNVILGLAGGEVKTLHVPGAYLELHCYDNATWTVIGESGTSEALTWTWGGIMNDEDFLTLPFISGNSPGGLVEISAVPVPGASPGLGTMEAAKYILGQIDDGPSQLGVTMLWGTPNTGVGNLDESISIRSQSSKLGGWVRLYQRLGDSAYVTVRCDYTEV